MKPIARAIDVGYGNTKFTLNDGCNGSGDIECMMFPSVAPVCPKGEMGDFMSKRDVALVSVNGQWYEVGPDAMMAMPSNASRALDTDFVRRDYYMALMLGAMHYMNVDRIDHLVVGLPVSNIDKTMITFVRDLLLGDHQLPNRTLHVGDVKVVPQPVGGMYDFGVRHQMMKELQAGINLLIDPGYFTLDWVVTTGTKMVEVRSGAANNAGMAAILHAIKDTMTLKIKERDGKSEEITEGILNSIDSSLRNETPFRFNGKVERLDRYMEGADTVIRNALDKLRYKVGTLGDIERVVIVGGASHLYQKAVCELFANHDVHVAKQAVFANVRGFQLMANSAAAASLKIATV